MEEEEKIKRISTGTLIKDLLSGTTITDKVILKNIWFIFLLTVLAAFYIANRFHAERITRETSRLAQAVAITRPMVTSVFTAQYAERCA